MDEQYPDVYGYDPRLDPDPDVIWEAVTESGAVYEGIEGGLVRYTGAERTRQTFLFPIMKMVPDVQPSSFQELLGLLGEESTVDVPVVGKRLYVGTLREWRLSTRIVSVAVFKE